MSFTARVGNPQRMEAGGACRRRLARSVGCREYAARLLDRPLRCRRSLVTSAGKQAGRSHALPAGYRHDRRLSRSERQPARTRDDPQTAIGQAAPGCAAGRTPSSAHFLALRHPISGPPAPASRRSDERQALTSARLGATGTAARNVSTFVSKFD